MDSSRSGAEVSVSLAVSASYYEEVWNANSTELCLRAEEVEGQYLLDLDLGLPFGELRKPIEAVVSGDADNQKLTVQAVTRRGRQVVCGVTIEPRDARDTITGAILLTEVVEPVADRK